MQIGVVVAFYCVVEITNFAIYCNRGVELESPGVRVLARSRSRRISFEGDFDSGPICFIWTRV